MIRTGKRDHFVVVRAGAGAEETGGGVVVRAGETGEEAADAAEQAAEQEGEEGAEEGEGTHHLPGGDHHLPGWTKGALQKAREDWDSAEKHAMEAVDALKSHEGGGGHGGGAGPEHVVPMELIEFDLHCKNCVYPKLMAQPELTKEYKRVSRERSYGLSSIGPVSDAGFRRRFQTPVSDQCQVPDLRSPCHSVFSPMHDSPCRLCHMCQICGVMSDLRRSVMSDLRSVISDLRSLDRNSGKQSEIGPTLVGNRSVDVWPVRFPLRSRGARLPRTAISCP